MNLILILSSKIPYETLDDLVKNQDRFIIATYEKYVHLLSAYSNQIKITVPNEYGYLKALAFTDSKLIRFEYETLDVVNCVVVYAPLYSGIFFKADEIRVLSKTASHKDFFTSENLNTLSLADSFMCKTSVFRTLAQAYKYQLEFEGLTSDLIEDRAKFLGFLFKSNCVIKKVNQ